MLVEEHIDFSLSKARCLMGGAHTLIGLASELSETKFFKASHVSLVWQDKDVNISFGPRDIESHRAKVILKAYYSRGCLPIKMSPSAWGILGFWGLKNI